VFSKLFFLPFYIASLIILSALTPYPYPREIDSKLDVMPYSSAKRIKSATGSEPVDRTKIKAVALEESLKHFYRSNPGAIINFLPV
jgi:hypothetical protein